MRTHFQQRVDEFMRKAGQELPSSPVVPDLETRQLRATLIMEEVLETVRALGFSVTVTDEMGGPLVELKDEFYPSMKEIADGCCDVLVVTLGTLSACGMNDESLMTEVCDSNDSKFIDGHRRTDGKWIKGPSYNPADIDRVLAEQMQ